MNVWVINDSRSDLLSISDRMRSDILNINNESVYAYILNNHTLHDLSDFAIVVNYICLIVFTVIAFVGICANLLVLFRMCTHPELRTPSNHFISNLALSDLVVLLLLVTRRILTFYSSVFLFDGTVVERVFIYIQYICIQSTALILATMSISRYHFTVHPLRARAEWTTTRVWKFCGSAWLVSAILYIPILFGILFIEGNTSIRLVPYPIKRKIFSTIRLFPMFIVPASIIIASYVGIVVTFKRRDEIFKKYNTNRAAIQTRVKVQGKKLTRMVIVVVLVFFIAWGPFQVLLTALDLRPYTLPRSAIRWKLIVTINSCFALLPYCGCTLNPFIYAFSNPSFFKLSLARCKCCLKPTSKSNSSQPPAVIRS